MYNFENRVPENVFQSFKINFENNNKCAVPKNQADTAVEEARVKVLSCVDHHSGGSVWILSAEYHNGTEYIEDSRYRATVFENGDIAWDTQFDVSNGWQSTHWQEYNHRCLAFKRALPEYYDGALQFSLLEVVEFLFEYEGYRYTHYHYASNNEDFILKQTVVSYIDEKHTTAQTPPLYHWEKYDQVKVDYIRKQIEENTFSPLQKSFLEAFPEYRSVVKTLGEKGQYNINDYYAPMRLDKFNGYYYIYTLETDTDETSLFCCLNKKGDCSEWIRLTQESELEIRKKNLIRMNETLIEEKKIQEQRQRTIEILERKFKKFSLEYITEDTLYKKLTDMYSKDESA